MECGTKFRYLFRSAEKEALKKLTSLLSPLNVTPNQAEVLLVLNKHEPLSLKELGELLVCEQKSPSRLVQALVDKELIYKGKAAKDARCSVLYLSKTGKTLIPQLLEKEAEFDKELHAFIEKNVEYNQIIACLQEYLKGTNSEKKLKLRSLWE